jgi:hypothetical protein
MLGAFIFLFCVFFTPFCGYSGLIGLAGKAILRGLVTQLTVSFLVID